MKRFAALMDALAFMPSRTGKIRLLTDYFANTPDPDRGWALAFLTGCLVLRETRPAVLRALAMERVDPVLFSWSHDHVGDLAETVALIWPERPGGNRPPELGEVVERLRVARRTEVPGLIEGWLDALDASARFALLKLISGGLRAGVSARLAKTALAEWAGRDVNDIEEVWHGLTPPYQDLFAWAEGRAGPPAAAHQAGFRPLMLANPLEEGELGRFDPAAFSAEWKWDGIRVQAVARGGERRLYSRTGDDIGAAFPDVLDALTFDAVLDGELLVVRDHAVAPFNDLQQRLNRKTATAKLVREAPAHIRLYDMLFDGGQDLRALSFAERRARLEAWHGRTRPPRMDLSPLIPFATWGELKALRDGVRESGIEGVMLKRRDSSYVAGRPMGPWFKWKRGALTLDTVLMYARPGHGKRSSYYAEVTFGAWRGEQLVPVGKTCSGFTDEELAQLDRWVRSNTVNRFGPVREVVPMLVLEVAFDSVQRSTRHKSGVAMRSPRLGRIRWDKAAHEADAVETLERLIVE
ncbi:MAG TPA: cisplatin damage response ATP-dependent DNA ligase [Azospirillaceae bacterium]|nr:cisplatin damage response ATP-dependent DNA ligase [Azospirillaceae bacterium]